MDHTTPCSEDPSNGQSELNEAIEFLLSTPLAPETLVQSFIFESYHQSSDDFIVLEKDDSVCHRPQPNEVYNQDAENSGLNTPEYPKIVYYDTTNIVPQIPPSTGDILAEITDRILADGCHESNYDCSNSFFDHFPQTPQAHEPQTSSQEPKARRNRHNTGDDSSSTEIYDISQYEKTIHKDKGLYMTGGIMARLRSYRIDKRDVNKTWSSVTAVTYVEDDWYCNTFRKGDDILRDITKFIECERSKKRIRSRRDLKENPFLVPDYVPKLISVSDRTQLIPLSKVERGKGKPSKSTSLKYCNKLNIVSLEEVLKNLNQYRKSHGKRPIRIKVAKSKWGTNLKFLSQDDISNLIFHVPEINNELYTSGPYRLLSNAVPKDMEGFVMYIFRKWAAESGTRCFPDGFIEILVLEYNLLRCQDLVRYKPDVDRRLTVLILEYAISFIPDEELKKKVAGLVNFSSSKLSSEALLRIQINYVAILESFKILESKEVKKKARDAWNTLFSRCGMHHYTNPVTQKELFKRVRTRLLDNKVQSIKNHSVKSSREINFSTDEATDLLAFILDVYNVRAGRPLRQAVSHIYSHLCKALGYYIYKTGIWTSNTINEFHIHGFVERYKELFSADNGGFLAKMPIFIDKKRNMEKLISAEIAENVNMQTLKKFRLDGEKAEIALFTAFNSIILKRVEVCLERRSVLKKTNISDSIASEIDDIFSTGPFVKFDEFGWWLRVDDEDVDEYDENEDGNVKVTRTVIDEYEEQKKRDIVSESEDEVFHKEAAATDWSDEGRKLKKKVKLIKANEKTENETTHVEKSARRRKRLEPTGPLKKKDKKEEARKKQFIEENCKLYVLGPRLTNSSRKYCSFCVDYSIHPPLPWTTFTILLDTAHEYGNRTMCLPGCMDCYKKLTDDWFSSVTTGWKQINHESIWKRAYEGYQIPLLLDNLGNLLSDDVFLNKKPAKPYDLYLTKKNDFNNLGEASK